MVYAFAFIVNLPSILSHCINMKDKKPSQPYFQVGRNNFCGGLDECYENQASLIGEDDLKYINCSEHSFISVTDLVEERHKNQTNWRNFDGTIFNSTQYWFHTEPDEQKDGEDCIVTMNRELRDTNCQSSFDIYCKKQNFTAKSNLTFTLSRDVFNNDSQYGCFKNFTTTSKLRCSLK